MERTTQKVRNHFYKKCLIKNCPITAIFHLEIECHIDKFEYLIEYICRCQYNRLRNQEKAISIINFDRIAIQGRSVRRP